MTPEEIRIVAEFVGAVLVAFITFFLTRSHYERKRQDDLADRGFNRRAVVHDRNIQMAREYVDKWENLLIMVGEVNSKVLMASNVEDIQQLSHNESLKKLNPLLEELLKQVSILNILNDEELLDWHRKLLPQLFPLIKYLLERIKTIVQINHFDIDENKLNTLAHRCRTSVVLFARMKYKLDELERNLK